MALSEKDTQRLEDMLRTLNILHQGSLLQAEGNPKTVKQVNIINKLLKNWIIEIFKEKASVRQT